jgi:hypothetical protein
VEGDGEHAAEQGVDDDHPGTVLHQDFEMHADPLPCDVPIRSDQVRSK